MSDYVIDKAIENIGGGETTPAPIQLPTLDVPLFEQTDKDPYDTVPLASFQSPKQREIEQMYKDARVFGERQPTGEQTVGDKATGMTEEAFDYLGTLAKDSGESLKQVFVGGPLDAAQSLLNTALDVGEWTYDKLGIPATDERFTFAESIVPPSEAPALRLQRNMVEFYSGFAGAQALTKGLQAATVTKSMINGMVADFITTDPREEKVQELLRKNPELGLPFVTAMHGEDNDANLWQKVETMYIGALAGLGIEGASVLGKKALKSLVNMTKNYKMARTAKNLADKQLAEEFVKESGVDNTLAPGALQEASITKEALPPIPEVGDEEADLLIEQIRKGKAGNKAFNMTLAGITNKKQVQRVIKTLVDDNIEKFSAQKGGVKSRELLQKEADELGLTVEKLLQRKKGTPTWDAANRASADIMERVHEDLMEAAELYANGKIGIDDFQRAQKVAEAISLQVSDMATMSGRAEQAWQAVGVVTKSPKAKAKQVEELSYIYGENAKEHAKALAKLRRMDKKAQEKAIEYAKAQGRLIPSWDDVVLARTNWLLSNPKTHIKNVVSNTAQAAAAISDSFFAEITGALRGHGDSVSGETVQMVKGMFAGFGDAMATAYKNVKNPKNAVPIFKDATKYSKLGQVEVANDLTTAGKAAGIIKYAVRGDAVGQALGAADDVFKLINYRGELRKQAHLVATKRAYQGESYNAFVSEFLKNPPAEFHLKALDAARENTFTRDRVGLGLAVEQLVRNPFWGKLDRIFLPFIGTNLNVLEQTMMRTPVLGLLTTRARQAIAESASNPRALDKLIGKQATGAAFLGTISYFMSEHGLFQPIVAGDDNREKFAKSVGITPNSFKFGNEYVNMDPLSPLTGTVKFLSNMKSLYDISSESQKVQLDEIMQLAAYAVGDFMNPTFLTDAGGAFVSALSSGDIEELRYVFTSIGSSVVPYNGILRQITKTGEKVDVRVAGGLDKWFEEATNSMMSVIAPEGIPKQRDMFGRPIKAEEGILGSLDPFTKTAMVDDPVVKELVRLVQADRMAVEPDEDTKLVLTMPRRTLIRKVGGIEKKYDLNANEYERLVMLSAGVSDKLPKSFPNKYDLFKNLMSNEQYAAMPDYAKKAMIHSIQEAYSSAATEFFFQIEGKEIDYMNHVKSVLMKRGITGE